MTDHVIIYGGYRYESFDDGEYQQKLYGQESA